MLCLAGKVREAQQKKDLELAEKIKLADEKLASVHCKDAREEKLAALRVANTKKHDFRSFMETFLAAATRIADGIDLDEFVAPSSPPQEG